MPSLILRTPPLFMKYARFVLVNEKLMLRLLQVSKFLEGSGKKSRRGLNSGLISPEKCFRKPSG